MREAGIRSGGRVEGGSEGGTERAKEGGNKNIFKGD